jgi:2-(1,2-epoxy-1,2-dihydrophenyl)acetyl-CoA isomerase
MPWRGIFRAPGGWVKAPRGRRAIVLWGGMEPSLLECLEEGVLTLTMNRPARRNALDAELIVRLAQRLATAADERAVRVVVLTGAGGAFCSGADLKEAMTAPPVGDQAQDDLMERAYNPAIRALRRMPKPVIAAIDGVATGYGASLALACDIRLASERARFSLIFARVGLTLDGGASWFLPRPVGLRAYELAMTGDLIDAPEAYRLGLVNHVYAEGRLVAEADALARRLADGAPLALAAIKATINASLGPSLDAVLEDERIFQRWLFASADVREGAMAFIEKRAARFKGE